jgi:hypothetical protein
VSTTFGPFGRPELEQLNAPSSAAVVMQSGSDWVLLETWMLLLGSAEPRTVKPLLSRSFEEGDEMVGLAIGPEVGGAGVAVGLAGAAGAGAAAAASLDATPLGAWSGGPVVDGDASGGADAWADCGEPAANTSTSGRVRARVPSPSIRNREILAAELADALRLVLCFRTDTFFTFSKQTGAVSKPHAVVCSVS